MKVRAIYSHSNCYNFHDRYYELENPAPLQTKPLSELSVDNVIRLLESLNLSNFCNNFEDNMIDGPTLMM